MTEQKSPVKSSLYDCLIVSFAYQRCPGISDMHLWSPWEFVFDFPFSPVQIGWAECMWGQSHLLGWSHCWKKHRYRSSAGRWMSKKRENDRRSMGHRGEWMTSEARFSTKPPSVHSAETRQSLAGLQLLHLSLLLSAHLRKCTHVKIYCGLMMSYNNNNKQEK